MNLKSLLAFNRGDDAAERALPATFPFQREIDRMLGDVWSGKVLSGMPAFLQAGPFPRMDVVERDDHVEVTAELPGLERADVHIELADDLLLIRGEKRQRGGDERGPQGDRAQLRRLLAHDRAAARHQAGGDRCPDGQGCPDPEAAEAQDRRRHPEGDRDQGGVRPDIRGGAHGTSTAAPSIPARCAAMAASACVRRNTRVRVVIPARGARAKKSFASARVRFATDRIRRSPHSSA